MATSKQYGPNTTWPRHVEPDSSMSKLEPVALWAGGLALGAFMLLVVVRGGFRGFVPSMS